MHWIKEVELVDSVDDLKSSSSTRGISTPNFEVFDARIASALNKIIHNSHFKRKISFRHDMNNRGKSSPSNPSPNSFMRQNENHRGPEVPEVKVPVVECRDGLARITLEELAITHFVNNGTLQNACTTRPRVVVGLGRSAHSHIVRLMNSRRKGLKRIMTKVLWLC